MKTSAFLPGRRSVREEEKGGREPNFRIQGKMKEENPICHPENKSPDRKIWYKFLTAISVLEVQLIMNQNTEALRRLFLLK